MRAQRLLLARAAPQMGGEKEQRMVLQIAADAAQIGDDAYPKRAQLFRGTDPGAQHKGRRMDGAGAEHDFATVEIPACVIDDRRNAADAPPLEQEPSDRRASHDRQVLAGAHAGVEVAHRGRAAARRRVWLLYTSPSPRD